MFGKCWRVKQSQKTQLLQSFSTCGIVFSSSLKLRAQDYFDSLMMNYFRVPSAKNWLLQILNSVMKISQLTLVRNVRLVVVSAPYHGRKVLVVPSSRERALERRGLGLSWSNPALDTWRLTLQPFKSTLCRSDAAICTAGSHCKDDGHHGAAWARLQ